MTLIKTKYVKNKIQKKKRQSNIKILKFNSTTNYGADKYYNVSFQFIEWNYPTKCYE